MADTQLRAAGEILRATGNVATQMLAGALLGIATSHVVDAIPNHGWRYVVLVVGIAVDGRLLFLVNRGVAAPRERRWRRG